eukprot:gene17752-21172_t
MSNVVQKKAINKTTFDDQEVYYNDNNWDASTLFSSKSEAANRLFASNVNSASASDDSKLQIKLQLKDWMKIVKENEKKQDGCFSISRADYVGVAEASAVELNCTFDILVFEQDQKVPLLPSSIAVKRSSILYSDKVNQEPRVADTTSVIGVESQAHLFFADAPGRYTVKMDVLVNYLTAKKNGFGFSTPKATFNQMSISVPREVQIKIDPASTSDETEGVSHDGQRTANVPPTSYLKVQWTDYEVDEPTDLVATETPLVPATADPGKLTEQTKATVQQYSMASVGEGVVMISSSIKYSVVSGSISSFEVIVGNQLNIQSVDGYDIKKWECFPIAPLIDIQGGSKTKVTEKLIKVVLNSPVESDYILNILSEIEMESTSGEVTIPSVRCRGSEISREKGFLVVESTANVEVDQLHRDGLTLIDKTEVPRTLANMTSGPMLLSYKFLVPKYSLTIKITKHSDLQVLVAFCEAASFIATLSTEGSLLKKLVLKIRNTQQQYIRITIPHQFEIWSTIVASKAVKPALDESGTVMIPLNKSSGEKGIQKPFVVEIVYKHTDNIDLHNQGILSVQFPIIDIPISNLYEYKYGEIKGNIKEVRYFSESPPEGIAAEKEKRAVGRGGGGGMRRNEEERYMALAPQQMMSNAMPLSNPMMLEGGTASNGEDTSGLKPVIVSIPTSGQLIRLHQLLVIQTEIFINVKLPYFVNCGAGVLTLFCTQVAVGDGMQIEDLMVL